MRVTGRGQYADAAGDSASIVIDASRGLIGVGDDPNRKEAEKLAALDAVHLLAAAGEVSERELIQCLCIDRVSCSSRSLARGVAAAAAAAVVVVVVPRTSRFPQATAPALAGPTG